MYQDDDNDLSELGLSIPKTNGDDSVFNDEKVCKVYISFVIIQCLSLTYENTFFNFYYIVYVTDTLPGYVF